MGSDLLMAVARHGQTDPNARGLWVGAGDDPLNETGLKQAEELAHSLREFHFDFIISSDKIRAKQTAQVLSKILQVPIFGHHPVLRDREYGALEGLTSDQIREKYGIEMRSLSREIDDLGAGETVEEVQKRVREFVDEARKTFAGKAVIVITHGAFIRSLYEMYIGYSHGLRFTNCSHFVVKMTDNGTQLIRDLTTIKS